MQKNAKIKLTQSFPNLQYYILRGLDTATSGEEENKDEDMVPYWKIYRHGS